jgi:hypothetical protein
VLLPRQVLLPVLLLVLLCLRSAASWQHWLASCSSWHLVTLLPVLPLALAAAAAVGWRLALQVAAVVVRGLLAWAYSQASSPC